MCVGPVCGARDRITESRDNIVFTDVSRYLQGFVNELDRDCVRLVIRTAACRRSHRFTCLSFYRCVPTLSVCCLSTFYYFRKVICFDSFSAVYFLLLRNEIYDLIMKSNN